MQRYEIGIDEAGRGPLAGPVSVGAACVPVNFDWNQIAGVNDSKKLTEKKREEIYKIAYRLRKEGIIDWSVSMGNAKQIDERGIVPTIKHSINLAINRVISQQIKYDQYCVLLDGGLKAPEKFINQETIIKGDSKEKVIGLASIVAKVTRDRYMVRKATESLYAPYDFATHKGYGTKSHREAIAKHGLSPLHRRSYCRNIKVL